MFLVIGCFWGRPQPRFIINIAGLVGFWGTSKVGKNASSLSNLAVAFSLSGLVVAFSLSGLMS